VDEEVPGFAGDDAFQAAEDVFVCLASGAEFLGVGLRAGIGGKAHERDLV